MRILRPSYYLPTIKGLVGNFVRGEAVYPFYSSFKITSRCHFGCSFCNMKKDNSKDLSTEDIKKILDNLSQSSVLMTSFEGGEPLLRNDIEEILKYVRKLKLYLLFTTSVKDLLEYPMKKYAKYIDFLHISMDEGHGNTEMFDLLPEITKLETEVSVQTVVTKDTVSELEWKIAKCHESGANIVVIPAAPMKGAEDSFPDIELFEKELKRLKKKYPKTIHTPLGYFDAYRKGKCSSASVIIAPNGQLYYPCHILEEKCIDLREVDLMSWLKSKEAKIQREKMKSCKINCGWYQYYAIDSYTSLSTVLEALSPAIKHRKKR